MPLDYYSCFAVALRGIHGNIDICQNDYNIPSKLQFSLYSVVTHGSITFNERLTKFNEKW